MPAVRLLGQSDVQRAGISLVIPARFAHALLTFLVYAARERGEPW